MVKYFRNTLCKWTISLFQETKIECPKIPNCTYCVCVNSSCLKVKNCISNDDDDGGQSISLGNRKNQKRLIN